TASRTIERTIEPKQKPYQKPQYTGSDMPGFSYLKEETFSCGGQTNTVKIYRHDKTGLEFVLVPGGSFMMGSDDGSSDEKPVHRVSIKPFLLCRTECTQEAWDRIGGKDSRKWRGSNLPIENVSWDACTAWCQKAGLRLPTEAEWEYACRAGTSFSYCFGDSDSSLSGYAWYDGNSGNKTHPVGEKKENAFGLYDMPGNVWEWCQDGYHDSYSGAPSDGSAWDSGASSRRVDRGGSWDLDSRYCRSANRNRYTPDCCYDYLGFRPALSCP
ncbi:MAG: formylglycine-generating enzyme family protein, partial [Planctomycetota bacterium]